jgi:hypothetical protein
MGNIQVNIELTSIILAIVAIWALRVTLRQLKTMQGDSKTQMLSIRASVLLSLDERFGTQSMIDARKEMENLMAKVNKAADEQWSSIALKDRRKKSLDTLYPQELETMRRVVPAEAYGRLMVAISFFETVGFVTRYEYVPLRDVLELFGPAIEHAGQMFKAHLKKLRDDEYQSTSMYDNFFWLITQIETAKEVSGGQPAERN